MENKIELNGKQYVLKESIEVQKEVVNAGDDVVDSMRACWLDDFVTFLLSVLMVGILVALAACVGYL